MNITSDKMKVIITPAKRMKDDITYLEAKSSPVFLKDTEILLKELKKLSVSKVKQLLKCSDKIAFEAYTNYQKIDLKKNTVPAILSYEGIQYDNLAAHIFTIEDYEFSNKYIRILSGFYGVLRPFDGVVPYRLELNNKLSFGKYRNLYEFWGNKMYLELIKDDKEILDLGAKQYTRILRKYLDDDVRYVKCYFIEKVNDEYKEIGVYVKQARGEMVRYIVKNRITTFDSIKHFNGLGYRFCLEKSDSQNYIFIREKRKFT